MNSKIIENLNWFLPEDSAREITSSKEYEKIQKDFTYFEEFISDTNMPNLVEVINKSILVKAELIHNPQLELFENIGETFLRITGNQGSQGNPVITVGPDTFGGLKIENKKYRHFPDLSISVNTLGYNRTDRDGLRYKGALIQAYNVPKEIAQIVLKDFTKVEAQNRNDILLKLAASIDQVEYNPENTKLNFFKQNIQEGGNTHSGIDEKAVYVFERQDKILSIYGNAVGHLQNQSHIELNIRVERHGIEFLLPSKRY